jgi:hypothetical protein
MKASVELRANHSCVRAQCAICGKCFQRGDVDVSLSIDGKDSGLICHTCAASTVDIDAFRACARTAADELDRRAKARHALADAEEVALPGVEAYAKVVHEPWLKRQGCDADDIIF